MSAVGGIDSLVPWPVSCVSQANGVAIMSKEIHDFLVFALVVIVPIFILAAVTANGLMAIITLIQGGIKNDLRNRFIKINIYCLLKFR